MPSFIVTDIARDLWVENFQLNATQLGLAPASWSVSKRALRGGRRDGVDLVQLDNGSLSLAILPTRGMGIWKGRHGDDALGWNSPVHDGPVNPAYVNLSHWGGLGWLEGFDELLARCGLENIGPPYAEGDRQYTLHGKIANIPASYLAIHIEETAPFRLTVEGHVEESKLFGPQIRMETRISTVPGSNEFTVRDEFVNLKDSPCELQVLYHWNLGPPFLEAGARFTAPVHTVAPRDPRAAEGVDSFETYEGPQPGFAEQAYFFELHADPGDGHTLALLRNRSGDKGVMLRFSKQQLPYFTLWKNSGGANEGFVTGLEPGTSYPNAKPFEKAQGRVLVLPVGGRHVAETTVAVFNTTDAVADAEARIRQIQAKRERKVLRQASMPFTPAS